MSFREFLNTHATSDLRKCIQQAIQKADESSPPQPIRWAHILMQLLGDPSVASRLSQDQLTPVNAEISRLLSDEQAAVGVRGEFAFDFPLIASEAVSLAKDLGAPQVSPLTFLALTLTNRAIDDRSFRLSQDALRRSGLTAEVLLPANPGAARADFTLESLGFGFDLTAKGRARGWARCPLVGADIELRRLTMLVSSGTESPVIVGEPGVGKSSLVYGLAYHIAKGTRPLIPPEMDSWTIVMISAVNLLAGTGGRGDLESRLEKMLTFFRRNPTVVPFFDEVHTLLDSTDPTSRSISTALKPAMAAGQFRCIGATTDREYARFIAGDDALSSRFTRLLVPEPDADSTIEILGGSIAGLTPAGCVLDVSEGALRAAARLTSTYQRSERQPRKAVRLLKGVITNRVYLSKVARKSGPIPITESDVATSFSDLSGIPVDELDPDRGTFYSRLGQKLASRVCGQLEAVEAAVSWLSLQAAGWVDSRRPRGRFLFLGPPGVGKTELALALAEEIMKDRGALVVKNMAEFRGEGARSRFMGADPGYVGYGETATIYSKIMMRPYSVVVLDEIEKAHADLSDPLLSVLDGAAEDAQGRWVDFSQCIFVMTSNALQEAPNADEGQAREMLRLRGGIWTPPLIDRIDRVAVFRPLDRDSQLKILEGLLARRRATAVRPLPPDLDDPLTRARIVDQATRSGGQSARALERALADWLVRAANSRHEQRPATGPASGAKGR